MSSTQSLRKGDLVDLDLARRLKLHGFPVLARDHVEAHKDDMRREAHVNWFSFALCATTELFRNEPRRWLYLLAATIGLFFAAANTGSAGLALIASVMSVIFCALLYVALSGNIWRRIPIESYVYGSLNPFRVIPATAPMPPELFYRAQRIKKLMPEVELYVDAFGADPILTAVVRHHFFKKETCYVGGWDTGDAMIDNA